MSCSEDEEWNDYTYEDDLPLSIFPRFPEWSIDPEMREEPTIHCLPDEILLQILYYLDILDLPRLSYVCRRWYNLYLSAFGGIIFLDLSDATKYDKDADENMRVQRTGKQMIALTRHSLKRCDLVSFPVTPEIFAAIRSCQNLTTLKLRDISVSKKVANTFSANAPPLLKTLIIEKCWNLREKCLKRLLNNVPNLVNLELVSQHCIKGMAILQYLQKHPLKRLKICFCEKIQWDTFFRILATFSNTLETLEFQITVFEELSLDRITPMPILKKLTIGDKSKYFECDMENHYSPVTKFLSIQTLPNLKELSIGGIIVKLVAENRLIQIVENLRCLEQLDHLDISCNLPDNPYFPHQSPPDLLPLVRLHNLRTLEANGDVTEKEFRWIASCRSLRSVSLQSSQVTDNNVVFLVSALEKLETLDLRNCLMITGDFVGRCKTLAHKNLLVVHCTSLEVSVKSCDPSFLSVTVQSREEEAGLWRDDYEDPYQYIFDRIR